MYTGLRYRLKSTSDVNCEIIGNETQCVADKLYQFNSLQLLIPWPMESVRLNEVSVLSLISLPQMRKD